MTDPAVPAPGLDFLVRKSDWRETRLDPAPVPDLGPGQVLFRVDRFALTANNISYALAGDALGYWRFFPAEEGWGRIPVMGYGDVIRSTHSGVQEGTRCFGFYPMSRYLVIEPAQASPAQIADGAAHRQGLAPAYNQYTPTATDALHHPAHEDALMLMRGLFMTSFLADDFLGDHDLYGARSVLISSASSKTSIALAFQVAQREGVRAIGLTSSRNRAFVEKLGFYDEVLLYDDVTSLSADGPVVYVDMAGDAALRRAIHEHWREALRYSCSIGATHWDAPREEGALPGPKPEFFFAPAQIQKRAREWGPAELQQRLAAAWSRFREASEAWLRVRRAYGPEALERVYRETLEGRTDPAEGHVLSLWESEAQASGR